MHINVVAISDDEEEDPHQSSNQYRGIFRGRCEQQKYAFPLFSVRLRTLPTGTIDDLEEISFLKLSSEGNIQTFSVSNGDMPIYWRQIIMSNTSVSYLMKEAIPQLAQMLINIIPIATSEHACSAEREALSSAYYQAIGKMMQFSPITHLAITTCENGQRGETFVWNASNGQTSVAIDNKRETICDMAKMCITAQKEAIQKAA